MNTSLIRNTLPVHEGRMAEADLLVGSERVENHDRTGR